MSDLSWRRHANPWSVYTRLATVPVAAATGWSRVWIGEWAWAPGILIATWLWLNVRVFSPVTTPTAWASKAIFGERLWMEGAALASSQRVLSRILVALGGASMLVLIFGVATLHLVCVALGCAGVVAAQLLRLALFAQLYERHRPEQTMSARTA
jgi:hypothetical protein